LKNATQFVAIVFAVPVKLAGTPEPEPAAEVAAGAEVAEVAAGAEVVAAAEEEELDELPPLLHAVAVSARHATPAAHATSDLSLVRRMFMGRSPPGSWLNVGY
jgi:hypothetical protein